MFLTTRNAAVDGDRSPWGQFWFEPIGMRTSAGERVTSMSAMRLSAVYSCVRVLSETFAVLPFCLYRKREDGGRDMVTDHWLYRLMKRPNDWQTGFEWREMMQSHLVLRGNAFNQIMSNGRGEITALLPIHPDAIQLKSLASGDFFYAVKMSDGTTKNLPRGDVWHIKGLSSDGFLGLNPIEMAAETLGLGQAAQSYGARFFANDTKPGGWIEAPPTFRFADSDAQKTFMEQWRAAYGGSNRGKTAVLTGGLTYKELKLNNSDAQFLESRKFSRSEIASIFRVPPHLIGDLEKATFSNIEQQSLDFVLSTMTPWAERWEASIETWLLPDDDDLEVEFEFAGLLRGDQAARSAYYTAGINAGWMTRNQARISEGMNPLPGLDEPLRPLNMVEESQASDELAENDDGADDQVQTPAPSNDARAIALAKAAAERVARKELQGIKAAMQSSDHVAARHAFYQKHVAFVATCLGVSMEAAQAYCTHQATQPLPANTLEEDFMSLAQSALERLAMKGTL